MQTVYDLESTSLRDDSRENASQVPARIALQPASACATIDGSVPEPSHSQGTRPPATNP